MRETNRHINAADLGKLWVKSWGYSPKCAKGREFQTFCEDQKITICVISYVAKLLSEINGTLKRIEKKK